MAHSPGFLKAVEEAKRDIRELTITQVVEKQRRGDVFHFFDVREDDEWKQGRAGGARHLGKGVIERDIEAIVPDKGAEIVLYCGGGFRSALAAASLKKMGYTRVASMDGGIREWRQQGLPEEKGT